MQAGTMPGIGSSTAQWMSFSRDRADACTATRFTSIVASSVPKPGCSTGTMVVGGIRLPNTSAQVCRNAGSACGSLRYTCAFTTRSGLLPAASSAGSSRSWNR